MNWPTPLDGDTPLHRWLNRFLMATRASQPLTTADVKVGRGPEGSQLKVNFPPVRAQTFFYPFKIYQYFGARRFQTDDAWRRLKVRDGVIRTAGSCAPTSTYQDWQAWGSDGGGDFDLFSSEYNSNYQIPPTDSSAVVTGLWNEAIIPDDGATYHIWFSFIDSTHDGALVYPHGLFYGKTFGTDGTDGSATSLYTGNVCTPISYGGYTDPYNIKIGSAYTSGGRLVVRQELFGHPHMCRDPFYPTTFRFRGAYDLNHLYYVGDVVFLDDGGSSSHDFRTLWVYMPPSSASSYYPSALMWPMRGVSPVAHSPDPWFRLSRSPIATSGTDPAWTTGAYDASRYYIRGS